MGMGKREFLKMVGGVVGASVLAGCGGISMGRENGEKGKGCQNQSKVWLERADSGDAPISQIQFGCNDKLPVLSVKFNCLPNDTEDKLKIVPKEKDVVYLYRRAWNDYRGCYFLSHSGTSGGVEVNRMGDNVAKGNKEHIFTMGKDGTVKKIVFGEVLRYVSVMGSDNLEYLFGLVDPANRNSETQKYYFNDYIVYENLGRRLKDGGTVMQVCFDWNERIGQGRTMIVGQEHEVEEPVVKKWLEDRMKLRGENLKTRV